MTDTELDARISRRLDLWGQMLLDLSKRNRLLYFNPGVGSQTRVPHGVKLSEPGIDTLWDRIARAGKKQTFLNLESELEQLRDEDEESGDDEDDEPLPPSRALKKDELRAEPEGPRLGRLLSNLRSRARTSFEEQGIITLFVAFGFLRWKEEGQEIFSPLLLVPVELARSSSSEPYHLRRHEEEVLLNPALKFKMESDFRIHLPDAPSLDEKSLAPFFGSVCQSISRQQENGWGVVDWSYLGLFSFHKIAMFRDLRDNRARLLQHPAVRALGGDLDVALNPVVDLPSGVQLDSIAPDEMELIIDADSSQHEAILAARAGLNFVLQGPPGTGKSQTITNIIAECLETGKKVLFVSEKMAALEVVHGRLKTAGLGDFCLEAHSHKANKKAVIDELGRTLQLARLAAPEFGDEDIDLASLRLGLGDYVREMHAVRAPSNLSAHRAMEHLTRWHQSPELPFAFESATEATAATRARLEAWLGELERSHAMLLRAKDHPWRGFALRAVGLQTMGAIRARCQEAVAAIGTMETGFEPLCASLGVRRFSSLHGLERLLELSSLVENHGDVPLSVASAWLESAKMEPLRMLAREQSERVRGLQERQSAFGRNWTNAVFNLPHDELQAALAAPSEWLARVGGSDAALEKQAALETHLGASATFGEVVRLSANLAATMGVDAPRSLTEAISLSALARLFGKRPMPRPHWFDDGEIARLQARAIEAKTDQARRRALEAELATRWRLDALLALPCEAMAHKFAGEYHSALARLRSGYKYDRAQLQGALLNASTFDHNAVTSDLRLASQLQALRLNQVSQTEAGWRDLGAHMSTHVAGETDWDAVLAALETCREIIANRDNHVAPRLIEALSGPASNAEIARETERELTLHLSRLSVELKALTLVLPLRDFPFSSLPLQHAPLDKLGSWLRDARAAFSRFFAAVNLLDACRAANLSAMTLPEAERALQEAQWLMREQAAWEASVQNLRASFGSLFDGQNTRWQAILDALDWSDCVLEWFGPNELPDAFRALLQDEPKRAELARQSDEMRRARSSLQGALDAAREWFPALQIFNRPPEHAPFEALRGWFAGKLEHLDELDDWLQFQNLGERAVELGASRKSGDGFWEQVQNAPPASDELAGAFWKRFWALWLDEMFFLSPLLRAFGGASHEMAIERFARLDMQNQKRAQGRLAALLSSRKPVLGLNAPRGGHMAILQREVVKKTRHLPLRLLFEQTGDLIQALKPCVLMSPLSVAQFLPAGKVEFDVVVFDEASQICPEDAIGAVSRARQVIVVGDNKQLPPTRFFGAAGSSDEDDDEDGSGDEGALIESILDDCSAAGLPQKMLRWHYRSRHEELIAFSNSHFYQGDLMTFPGPYALDAPDGQGRALEWERVEGFYQPGGKGAGKDANTNRIEARRVAEMAIQHARTRPHESLGIITFNEAQRRAVEEAITLLAADDADLHAFFNNSGSDPFFVKNLENVQGDERDVIFFSVGFGPQRDAASGAVKQMSLNFGPLTRLGGERRLNVAVTRARIRVKIVTSFEPSEIDPNRTRSRGAALLRGYLEFARSGAQTLELRQAKRDEKDEIAQSLATALEARGLTVRRGVGLGDYRVDVAIEDPSRAGRLQLGVLCDGANYAGAATARDRDRLRPQVLQLLGWQLHRVWSPDWIKNPARETQKVLDALERANRISSAADAVVQTISTQPLPPQAVSPSPPAASDTSSDSSPASPVVSSEPSQVISDPPSSLRFRSTDQTVSDLADYGAVNSDVSIGAVINIDVADEDEEGAVSLLNDDELIALIGDEGNAEVTPRMSTHVPPLVGVADEAGDEVIVEVAPPEPEPSNVFVPVELPRLGSSDAFYVLAQSNPAPILEALLRVVDGEGPVSVTVATRRVVAAWGMGKAGQKLVDIVSGLARQAARKHLLQVRGEWLWPADMERPIARPPLAGLEPRPLKEIAPQEIAEAALLIVQQSFSIEREALIVQIARFFGFKQTGVNVRARIETALELLDSDDRLHMQDGQFVID